VYIKLVNPSAYIIQVQQDDFPQSVLEASFQQPVLVDFWADWCQPCRSLMPVLADLAQQYQGAFILAKINTEDNPSLASSLGIRSLPTVRLYIDGESVDEFMGALPEAQIRQFLDRHIASELDLLLEQAEQLGMQGEQAEALVAQAAGLDGENDKVKLAQARLAAASGDNQRATDLIASLGIDAQASEQAVALSAQLQLDNALSASPPLPQLEARLAENAKDSEARYLLAMHAINQQAHEKGLEQLLEIMRIDPDYNAGAARKAMLDVFNLLGGSGQLVARYRSKLFTLMH
jgi:putative thioredoxin